jgi:hypothetical protein
VPLGVGRAGAIVGAEDVEADVVEDVGVDAEREKKFEHQ